MRNLTIAKLSFLGVVCVAIAIAMLYVGQKWPATIPAGGALWLFFLAFQTWRSK